MGQRAGRPAWAGLPSTLSNSLIWPARRLAVISAHPLASKHRISLDVGMGAIGPLGIGIAPVLLAVDVGLLVTDPDVRIDRQTGFAVFDDELVIVEGPAGEVHFEIPSEVAAYVDAFDRLMKVAWLGDDA